MDFGKILDKIKDKIRDKPMTSLAVTNVVTLAVASVVYARSSGLSFSQMAQLGALKLIKAVPGGNALVEAEKQKQVKKIETELLDETKHEETFFELPATGVSVDELETTLDRYAKFDVTKYGEGKVSGAVYHGGQDLSELIASAYRKFVLANPLHPDVFPMVRKMEAEVVQMTIDIFNGGPEAVGVVTSGGTESIIMAMKAYRDKALEERGVIAPEMVVPRTAHAAFDKAAHYFRIKLVHIDVNPETFMVEPEEIEKAITSNTICIVGSAPQYPHGVIDPIEQLSAIAVAHGIPLHVDCCLGSFCIAFAKAAGFPTKAFDFSLEGVTSISCDTHKYGFAPKGTSTILYRSSNYRKYSYFVATNWPGGIYASPGVAGSRPGALVAGAWAVMMHMGKSGYTECVRTILGAAKKITAAVEAHPQVKLFGTPELSVVSFGSADPSISIYGIGDGMKARGWNLNFLQFPTCAHICVTYANARNADKFVDDLRDSIEEVSKQPNKYKDGAAAIYGLATAIADRSMVADLAKGFIDTCYKVRPKDTDYKK